MPSISIDFSESAISDLEAIESWYESQGISQVGKRFVTEIVGLVGNLSRHPDMGRIVPEFDQAYLRELIHPPFRIIYRRDLDMFTVVRIWRNERQLILNLQM